MRMGVIPSSKRLEVYWPTDSHTEKVAPVCASRRESSGSSGTRSVSASRIKSTCCRGLLGRKSFDDKGNEFQAGSGFFSEHDARQHPFSVLSAKLQDGIGGPLWPQPPEESPVAFDTARIGHVSKLQQPLVGKKRHKGRDHDRCLARPVFTLQGRNA